MDAVLARSWWALPTLLAQPAQQTQYHDGPWPLGMRSHSPHAMRIKRISRINRNSPIANPMRFSRNDILGTESQIDPH
ncbi:MAG: hypothetical protein EA001_08140 [Oscillatoriales cyanobacterium]|nr:MAG: hypothetical protein EA001_08140 [Oscillatoriales cyanobacterium]